MAEGRLFGHETRNLIRNVFRGDLSICIGQVPYSVKCSIFLLGIFAENHSVLSLVQRKQQLQNSHVTW